MNPNTIPAAVLADFAHITPVRCPCGRACRAFGDLPDAPASLHQVEIELDARTHYHREHTEIYYILECAADAAVELNGERVAVHPGSAVMIPPGVALNDSVAKMPVSRSCKIWVRGGVALDSVSKSS